MLIAPKRLNIRTSNLTYAFQGQSGHDTHKFSQNVRRYALSRAPSSFRCSCAVLWRNKDRPIDRLIDWLTATINLPFLFPVCVTYFHKKWAIGCLAEWDNFHKMWSWSDHPFPSYDTSTANTLGYIVTLTINLLTLNGCRKIFIKRSN